MDNFVMENGVKVNGVKVNGVKVNGVKENGVKENGVKENGVKQLGEAHAAAERRSLLTLDQRNSCSDLFISISGLIGAGKTTLATKLAERMNLPCFYEPVIDNAYLADFYEDPARYSFPMQVRTLPHFLTPLKFVLHSLGVSPQQKVPATPADHLAGTGWSPGQDHL